MAELGNLVIRLVGDISSYSKSLDRAEEKTKEFAKRAKQAGRAAGVGGAGAGIFSLAALNASRQRLDEMAKSARALGVEIDDIRTLQLGAEFADIDFNRLEGGIAIFLQRARDFAREGEGELADAFDELGFSQERVNELMSDSVQLFTEFGRAASRIEGGRGLALLAEAFGARRASGLAAAFRGGDFERARQQVQSFGTGRQIDAEQIEAFNDSITALTGAFKQLSDQTLVELIPAINAVTEGLEGLVAAIPFLRATTTGETGNRQVDTAVELARRAIAAFERNQSGGGSAPVVVF